ncbi:hypothetical protein TrLO_g1765, partial [Triparma laevis f. longispina]
MDQTKGPLGVPQSVIDSKTRTRQIITFHQNKDLEGLLNYINTTAKTFDSINHATAFNRLSKFKSDLKPIKFDPRFQTLLSNLESTITSHPTQIDVRCVANVAHALSVLNIESSQFNYMLKSRSKEIIREGNSQAIANVAYSLGKMKGGEEFFRKMDEGEGGEKVLEGKAQEISNTIWASAKVGWKMSRFISGMGGVVGKIVEGHPQAIANVTWGLATVGCSGEEEVVKELTREFEDEAVVERFVRQGSPQAIANTLWGFTTMNVDVPLLRRVVCRDDVATKIFNHNNPNTTQNMSNIVWCLAKAAELFSSNGSEEKWREGVVDKFSEAGVVRQLVTLGKPQEISSIVWALTAMKCELSSELVKGINRKEVVERIAKDGSSQCVTNILWCLSKGGLSCKLSDAIDNEESVKRFLDGTAGNPQNIAIALWSLANMKRYGHKLLEMVDEQEVVDRFLEGSVGRDVSNAVWGLGVLRSYRPNLLESIGANVERFTKDANPQVLSNIVHGYAKLGVFDERVFGAVGDEAAKVAKDGQMHEITNIIWAFAVAGMVRANEGRILELWEEAWRRVEGEGSEVELIQLENARLLAKECEGVELEIGGGEGMRERVERAIERQWEEGG